MKHLHAYIIKPIDGRYTNNKKIGDSNLILNTQIEDHKFVNRQAKIIETPINNPIFKKDDIIIVHHNVFRRYFDVRGEERNSSSYFKIISLCVMKIKYFYTNVITSGLHLKVIAL